jgi:hypothetical protein
VLVPRSYHRAGFLISLHSSLFSLADKLLLHPG